MMVFRTSALHLRGMTLNGPVVGRSLRRTIGRRNRRKTKQKPVPNLQHAEVGQEKHYAKWDVNRQNRLDAFMEPEVHCTYPIHEIVERDKSLLNSLIAGAKGGTRTSNDS